MSQKPSYTNADGSYKTSAEVKAEPVTLTGCQPGSDINVAGYEVGTLGGADGHILAFNKFPAARPHFLILTADGYRRQFEALNGNDLWSMWVVMGKFNAYIQSDDINGVNAANEGKRKQRHISFFNCGLKSGCSRLHKHMQVFPILAEQDLEKEGEDGEDGDEFKLWPDIEDPGFYKEVLPFKVAIARFKKGDGPITKEKLLETYQRLLKEAEGWLRESFEKQGDGDQNGVNVPGWAEQGHRAKSGENWEQETAAVIPHNVLLDRDWMVVIPRREAAWMGGDCNAISMLGMNWVSGEDKIEKWVGLGPAEVLRRVGVPVRA